MATFPAFSLPVTGGGTLARRDLTGSRYVIYCYPKDLTPGCTTESCDFRDNLSRLQTAGIRVFGLSPDPIAKHERFIAKHDLNFPLLSDTEHVLLEKLGVWKEKSLYGRTYMGVERSTFVVGPDHQIEREWRRVKVKGHVDEVLAFCSGDAVPRPP
ncbi:MAG: peroxiredoxin [Planctomycetota bacterium]